MLYCARCDAAVMSSDLNGHAVQICPMCGAVYQRIERNLFRFAADLGGAQGVKELMHASRPYDPIDRIRSTA